MADCMEFPKTADEFIEQYKFTDIKQEYTNGSELIAVFRVKQMIEHYFATDNNVGGKWIPVTERLPGICEPVLVCSDFMGGKVMRVTDRYGKDGKIWAGLYNGEKPTHWMPLPEPPKGE